MNINDTLPLDSPMNSIGEFYHIKTKFFLKLSVESFMLTNDAKPVKQMDLFLEIVDLEFNPTSHHPMNLLPSISVCTNCKVISLHIITERF